MDVGGLVHSLEIAFAIAAVATLLVTFAATAFGVRRGALLGATDQRLFAAMVCGLLSGLAVAATVVWLSLCASSLPGLLLAPVLGCAASYWSARTVASWTQHPEE